MENMFSISFRKCCDKKGRQLLYFIHQNVNSLCSHHHSINSWRQVYISLSSRNTTFNQSYHNFFRTVFQTLLSPVPHCAKRETKFYTTDVGSLLNLPCTSYLHLCQTFLVSLKGNHYAFFYTVANIVLVFPNHTPIQSFPHSITLKFVFAIETVVLIRRLLFEAAHVTHNISFLFHSMHILNLSSKQCS